MNGQIAAASDVLVCRLPGFFFVFFFFGFFTHSCVNNCTNLSRVKTELTVKEDKLGCPFIGDIYITVLAPVVQIFYGAINQINHYPVDKYTGYQLRCALD